jgi:GTP-binding protein LepA
MDIDRIRNFAIVAHIDHGKSTLADRLLERTGTLRVREKVAQYLDKMELERERGITIKAQTARMAYRARDGKDYILNLIDTPGHVDFHYEVSRSLAACEGVLLVVDAAQGVEAQTLANAEIAIGNGLEVIPVLNKVDLPNADVDNAIQEIEDIVGIPAADEAIRASAKSGIGIDDVLEAIVSRIPPPKGDREGPLRALVFDSWYDSYQGVVILMRIVDGVLERGDRILLMETDRAYDVALLGVMVPEIAPVESVGPGEVAVVTAAIRDPRGVKIGETITHAQRPATEALPGFVKTQPMVWSGLYPTDPGDYEPLRNAIEKLQLNDAAIFAEPETSDALGFGFRCGYLGLLHMEVAQERLEREYELDLIITAPTVVYQVVLKTAEVIEIHRPSDLPAVGSIEEIREPRVLVQIHVPTPMIGPVLQLCQDRRGIQRDMAIHGERHAVIRYEMPLAEVVTDFFDKLKSATHGYASMDYEFLDYRAAKLVKLDILVNGDPVDALSIIVHQDHAYRRGVAVLRAMKDHVPRQMFEVALQAAMGSKIIARVSVKALRKNVTAKCYGGDITRKKKLLEKQKEGKRRMRRLGRVELPQEAFLAVLTPADEG